MKRYYLNKVKALGQFIDTKLTDTISKNNKGVFLKQIAYIFYILEYILSYVSFNRNETCNRRPRIQFEIVSVKSRNSNSKNRRENNL